MIFRLFIYALTISFFATESYAKIVKVNVTGYGVSHKLAVVDGLKNAISQVSGITVNSDEDVKLSSLVEEDTADDNSSSKQHFSEASQSDISTKINGFVSSYQVLSSHKNGSGNYETNLVVEIEKYEIPGMDNNRRGIAVLGFKANNAQCFGKQLQSSQQTDEVTLDLVNALTATRKFSVLDRDNEDVYLMEKSLIQSDDAKSSEAAKLSQVKGTDYILTGTVKNLSINANKTTIELTGESYTTYRANAEVDFKLIAFASRQVKFASNVKVSLGNSEISSKGCQDILSILMQKASSQIVDKCIENIYPPMVVNVNGQNIYLNIGGDNVTENSLYDLYSVGETIIDPYTNESLGAEEIKIGTVKITEVKPKYSIGVLEKGEISEVKKGQLCRKSGTH